MVRQKGKERYPYRTGRAADDQLHRGGQEFLPRGKRFIRGGQEFLPRGKRFIRGGQEFLPRGK